MPHTPGPWRVMQGVVRPRVSTADGSTTVAGNICSLGNAEIGEANARLIAAAPDLLAACKFIIWAVSTEVPPPRYTSPADYSSLEIMMAMHAEMGKLTEAVAT